MELIRPDHFHPKVKAIYSIFFQKQFFVAFCFTSLLFCLMSSVLLNTNLVRLKFFRLSFISNKKKIFEYFLMLEFFAKMANNALWLYAMSVISCEQKKLSNADSFMLPRCQLCNSCKKLLMSDGLVDFF